MLIEEKQMELSRQEDVLRIDHKGNTTKIERILPTMSLKAKIISYAIEHSYLPLWEIKYTFHQKERLPN